MSRLIRKGPYILTKVVKNTTRDNIPVFVSLRYLSWYYKKEKRKKVIAMEFPVEIREVNRKMLIIAYSRDGAGIFHLRSSLTGGSGLWPCFTKYPQTRELYYPVGYLRKVPPDYPRCKVILEIPLFQPPRRNLGRPGSVQENR